MADLDVVAVLKAKPGSESIVQEALAEVVVASRNDPGCISYQLLVSTTDAATFYTIEKWQSQQDLDAHMKTEHVQKALAAVGEHFDGQPELTLLSLLV